MFNRNRLLIAAALAIVAACVVIGLAQSPSAKAAAEGPSYTKDGDMLPPTNYRQWTYLTSGLGMSYTAGPNDVVMFDNVFVNPDAYRSFVATGIWPDKTMLVLETREAKSKGSINQQGHFQGTQLMGLEVHVKDETRFPGKWAFFAFDSPEKNGSLIPQGAPCYTCHAAHGAVDTTFMQFYPTLLPIAELKKTFSDAYLKDQAAQVPAK